MRTQTVTIDTRSVKETWRSNCCFSSETRDQAVIQLRAFWQTSLVVIVLCVFLSRVRNPHQTFSCWESLSSRVVWRYRSDLRASHSSLFYRTILAAVHTVQDTKYHEVSRFGIVLKRTLPSRIEVFWKVESAKLHHSNTSYKKYGMTMDIDSEIKFLKYPEVITHPTGRLPSQQRSTHIQTSSQRNTLTSTSEWKSYCQV